MNPFPVFLTLRGRRTLLVGGGRVAAAKLEALLQSGARVMVVAPRISPALARAGVALVRRAFEPGDLDGCWFAVAAATPEVNRQVAAAAERRRIFVNAVDDPSVASAWLSGVVRKGGVTLAISTAGRAPALASLLRQALAKVLPDDLGAWMATAERMRSRWRRERVPMDARRPMLLSALQEMYR
jgi:uroporphyrin-III C-methyltransferase/precorrin-2 dehydrogenase/sirohydrochlorin ferrochelatase